MRPPYWLCVPQRLKAAIVEPEETVVVRQRLGKHVPTATNTHATTEELLDAVFSMSSMSYQVVCSGRKVVDYFFPELLVILYN
jgi:hypothetical protein